MGIVHRPTFEAQLRLYLQGTSTDQDTAWHTLRHTIYASGCRIILSESLSFHEANNTAWSYFENALALLAGTILFQTSITSIQALTVMVRVCYSKLWALLTRTGLLFPKFRKSLSGIYALQQCSGPSCC